MKILYISRRYPPSIGGMEKLAYEVYRRLSKKEDVEFLVWSGSNKWLFIILPFFVFKSIFILLTRRIDVIHLGDGSIIPMLLALKFFKKPITVTIHALDITYSNRLYQFLIPRCLRKADKIICISNYAKEECIKRKIAEKNLVVILCGVTDEFYIKDKNIDKLKKEIEKKFNILLKNKKIIFSVGRLVERKGFHWFIEKVVPQIVKGREDFIYILAGDGPYREKIDDLIQKNNLNNYVYVLGKIDDRDLKIFYNISDLFIMPNIPVEGDAEGFGLVILEAASCNLPIIASNLEGIKDAAKGYAKGFLLVPGDEEGYYKVISSLLENNRGKKETSEKSREYIIYNYSWDLISEKYIEEFKKVIIKYNDKNKRKDNS